MKRGPFSVKTPSMLLLTDQPQIRQEERAQRLTFWVRRPPGGVGVFHAKGWWSESSCPSSKVCLSWKQSGMSREFCRDIPAKWGCSKSLCKKARAHFSFPNRNLVLQRVLNIWNPSQNGWPHYQMGDPIHDPHPCNDPLTHDPTHVMTLNTHDPTHCMTHHT